MFDNSDIPGGKIDLIVVNTETRNDDPALGKAVTGAWYEVMSLIWQNTEAGKVVRGELPHHAGINTFLKALYTEEVAEVGQYDAIVLGATFDGGTTDRPGMRFDPQGVRKISAL